MSTTLLRMNLTSMDKGQRLLNTTIMINYKQLKLELALPPLHFKGKIAVV